MRKYRLWAETYEAWAADYTFIRNDEGKVVAIRLFDAIVRYPDGSEQYLHTLEVPLAIVQGWGEVYPQYAR
jgi:hypothetical protein